MLTILNTCNNTVKLFLFAPTLFCVNSLLHIDVKTKSSLIISNLKIIEEDKVN